MLAEISDPVSQQDAALRDRVQTQVSTGERRERREREEGGERMRHLLQYYISTCGISSSVSADAAGSPHSA